MEALRYVQQWSWRRGLLVFIIVLAVAVVLLTPSAGSTTEYGLLYLGLWVGLVGAGTFYVYKTDQEKKQAAE